MQRDAQSLLNKHYEQKKNIVDETQILLRDVKEKIDFLKMKIHKLENRTNHLLFYFQRFFLMVLVANNTNSSINKFDPIEEKIQSLQQLQMELKIKARAETLLTIYNGQRTQKMCDKAQILS
ncbi:unnamed protein product [Rotaria sp. Silwood2]|nr:unnamed protein product [Rotaria sp. Silwood2]